MKLYISLSRYFKVSLLGLSLISCTSYGPSYSPATATYYPNQPNIAAYDVITPASSYFNYNYSINYGHTDIHKTDNYNTFNNAEPLTTRYY